MFRHRFLTTRSLTLQCEGTKCTSAVGEVKGNFNFKHVNFRCLESETGSNIKQPIDVLTSAAEAATTKTIDAFQILMAGGRTKVDQQPNLQSTCI